MNKQNNIYNKTFSTLKNPINIIEKKSGGWIAVLILSGIISLLLYIIGINIFPSTLEKTPEIALPFIYFSKSIVFPIKEVFTIWLITRFSKKYFEGEFSNKEFFARSSLHTLISSFIFGIFNSNFYIVNLILTIIVSFIYPCIMYGKLKSKYLTKGFISAFFIRLIISLISFFVWTSFLFIIISR